MPPSAALKASDIVAWLDSFLNVTLSHCLVIQAVHHTATAGTEQKAVRKTQVRAVLLLQQAEEFPQSFSPILLVM